MFSSFTLGIKFDCLFLASFQSFHWFVSFIFDKLASINAVNLFLVHTKKKAFKRVLDLILNVRGVKGLGNLILSMTSEL